MKIIRKASRGPPVGCMIGEHRYFTVAEATRFVGPEFICEATLWTYCAKNGGIHPSSGLDLCMIRFPLLRSGHDTAKSERRHRFMLRADRLLLLRELLQDHRRARKGRIEAEDLELMRDRVRLWGAPVRL